MPLICSHSSMFASGCSNMNCAKALRVSLRALGIFKKDKSASATCFAVTKAMSVFDSSAGSLLSGCGAFFKEPGPLIVWFLLRVFCSRFNCPMAAFTLTCCPTIARHPASNLSMMPGNRRPFKTFCGGIPACINAS